MIRAALVGVSGYGRWHLLMAMEQVILGRMTLLGATVINRREQAGVCRRLERMGVPVFDTFEQMMEALAGRVDLVLLPVGLPWHARMAIAALRAGAHVLVEKPLAPTLAEADAIMAAQAGSGRLVAVGFQDLYVPATHDIKRRLIQGEIGTLRAVVVRGQWPRSSAYFERNNWAGRLRVNDTWVLDSPVNNAYAHFLMLALFWAGSTREAAAEITHLEAELYRVGPIESFDTVCFRAGTAAGGDILFYGTHAGSENLAPEIDLIGDRGAIRWRYEQAYTVTRNGEADLVLPVPDQLDTRLSVLDAVLDRLEGRAVRVVEPALAREHTRVVNALHQFFPIHSVDAACVRQDEQADGVHRRIRDVDAVIARCAGRRELFSEGAAPWAVGPAGRQSLSGYESFAGCLTV